MTNLAKSHNLQFLFIHSFVFNYCYHYFSLNGNVCSMNGYKRMTKKCTRIRKLVSCEYVLYYTCTGKNIELNNIYHPMYGNDWNWLFYFYLISGSIDGQSGCVLQLVPSVQLPQTHVWRHSGTGPRVRSIR